MIVNSVRGGNGIFKAEAGAEKAAGDVIIGFSLDPAIFEAGRDGLPAAAVDADAAAGKCRSGLGRDVEDAGRT